MTSTTSMIWTTSTILSNKKPEARLQNKAIEYLQASGIYYLNLFGDGWSGKGKPDLIACINGRFVAFELKVGSNSMQADQRIQGLQQLRRTAQDLMPILPTNPLPRQSS